MFLAHLMAVMSSIAIMFLAVNEVSAQDYPAKPIRIMTSAAGGGSDFVSRIIAQGISGPLGQPVTIDNRGGTVLGELLTKAPPDGYTLMVNGGTVYIVTLLQKMPYDPVKDFAPITITSAEPNVLVVHPSLPVHSVKELVALAKARPGQLNYASGVPGSTGHLAGELFKSMAGVNIVHVPYKGSAEAFADLLSGQVQMTFNNPSALKELVRAGKLRALAITTAQPSALYPELPTVAATIPGYEAVSMTGVYAPANTPAAIINRLNQEMVRVLKAPEAQKNLLNAGQEVVASPAEQLASWMKADIARWGKVIKDAGIKVQ